ncbi:MAG: transcriptional regulator [Actinomycetaceae bacterium]
MTRRSRRVIALSGADRARLESGELGRPEDALGEPEPRGGADDAEPTRALPAGEGTGAAAQPTKDGRRRGRESVAARTSAEDERLLREVPPHFGRL